MHPHNHHLATSRKLVITNPKRGAQQLGRDQWFPYYAGFSSEFAKNILTSSSLDAGAAVLDPWNGSGTTTFSAVLNGYEGIGFDLNPVMAVVAKARLLPHSEVNRAPRLLADILKTSALLKPVTLGSDPLETWFASEAATAIRRIERSIFTLLVSSAQHGTVTTSVHEISCLAALFYLALFRAVRLALRRFQASNPTWIRRPSATKHRSRITAARIRACFSEEVAKLLMSSLATPLQGGHNGAFNIRVASSNDLPVTRGSIDFILSSPPYCTRIDYGIATLPELAVIGFEIERELRDFRAGLIGTPTIHADTPEREASWGKHSFRFLDRVWKHPSKASRTYYYKTYAQYFASMALSLSELGRALRVGGRCVLVVQDSYFKDVHLDLPTILVEMAESASLQIDRRKNFLARRTLGAINSASRRYRATSSATESVLCFVRQP